MRNFNKKYIFTSEEVVLHGHTLHRIQATKDFCDVKAGDLGGLIENEKNLSQENTCWVYPGACAFEKSLIIDDAKLHEEVMAHGCCVIAENANLKGRIHIYGNSYITGDCTIKNMAKLPIRISGAAEIRYNAEIIAYSPFLTFLNEKFKKHAKIHSNSDYLCIGPIGSRSDYTTFYNTEDQGIWVTCGCFNGSIDDFKRQMKKTHPRRSQYRKEYTDAIRMAKMKLTKIKLSPSDML